MKGTDKNGYIAGTTVSSVTMKAFGILTDDTDTGSAAEGDNIPAVCYITGHFNRGAVAVKADATIDTYEDELKGIGSTLQTSRNTNKGVRRQCLIIQPVK